MGLKNPTGRLWIYFFFDIKLLQFLIIDNKIICKIQFQIEGKKKF